jgi:hypothetical protein
VAIATARGRRDEERLSERGVIASGVHFVAKPFEQGVLLDKIARVLASENPGALGPDAEQVSSTG